MQRTLSEELHECPRAGAVCCGSPKTPSRKISWLTTATASTRMKKTMIQWLRNLQPLPPTGKPTRSSLRRTRPNSCRDHLPWEVKLQGAGKVSHRDALTHAEMNLPGFDLQHPGMTLKADVIVPLHLTVSEAAEKLGVSRHSLSRVLNGKAAISFKLAIRLETAHVKVARLMNPLPV